MRALKDVCCAYRIAGARTHARGRKKIKEDEIIGNLTRNQSTLHVQWTRFFDANITLMINFSVDSIPIVFGTVLRHWGAVASIFKWSFSHQLSYVMNKQLFLLRMKKKKKFIMDMYSAPILWRPSQSSILIHSKRFFNSKDNTDTYSIHLLCSYSIIHIIFISYHFFFRWFVFCRAESFDKFLSRLLN